MPEFVRWYNYDRYHMGIKFVCLLTCILTVQTLPMSVDITNSTSLYIVKTIHGQVLQKWLAEGKKDGASDNLEKNTRTWTICLHLQPIQRPCKSSATTEVHKISWENPTGHKNSTCEANENAKDQKNTQTGKRMTQTEARGTHTQSLHIVNKPKMQISKMPEMGVPILSTSS